MPKAQRSRACQQCRERRVKCDETPEFCQQCRRLGLQCSGPVQGSVIIDMTDRVAKPRQRKKRDSASTIAIREKDPSAKNRPAPRAAPDAVESATPLHVEPPGRDSDLECTELGADEAIAAIRYQYKLPTTYQPSKIVSDALDRAFISHFVQLNKGVRSVSPEIPWITHLPNMHERATKPALRLSIRAASMAFYATVHRDTTILVDSYRWYTMSLNCQRLALARLGSDAIPTSEEMLVPIILSLYEVWAGTTSTSLWHHLSAATKIIELRGPKNCTGVAFPIFKAMRVSDAHRAVVFNQSSVFAAPDWMTLPFIGQERNAHQHLADILLAIPECMSLSEISGSLRMVFQTPNRPDVDLIRVQERATRLLHDLDRWAARFPHLTTVSTGEQVVTEDMKSHIVPGDQSAPPVKSMVLPDSFTALTAATYEATRLILSLLLNKVKPPPAEPPATPSIVKSEFPDDSPPSLVDIATMSAKSILNITSFLESTHPVGFDFMRSVFPLVVVGILGPQMEQQKFAQQMLERWGKMRGMKGLCTAWLHA